MRTPTPRRSNTRASARAARLEASKVQKLADELKEDEARVANEEALIEPLPEVVLPPIMAPGIPMTFTELQPVELPRNELVELASRINARFGVIQRHEKVTFDHRLAWAIDIAAAKAKCKEKNEPWERWAKGHLELSIEMVRQYARIGSSGDPEAELRRIRERNAEANREHRQLQKDKKERQALAAPDIAPPPPSSPEMPEEPEVSRDPVVIGGHGKVDRMTPDVASELRNDRVENTVAVMKELLTPDLLAVIKRTIGFAPREAAIEALREAGFTVIGFSLNTAAE